MITRLALQGHELQIFESKLTAVGFGFFVPFFFVTSGIDLRPRRARLGRPAAAQARDVLLPLPGRPRRAGDAALSRRAATRASARALAFYSATELPLVVAITTIAIEAGHMKTSTAAGLVGAAMLSTLIFPFVARAFLERAAAAGETGPPGGALPTAEPTTA